MIYIGGAGFWPILYTVASFVCMYKLFMSHAFSAQHIGFSSLSVMSSFDGLGERWYTFCQSALQSPLRMTSSVQSSV